MHKKAKVAQYQKNYLYNPIYKESKRKKIRQSDQYSLKRVQQNSAAVFS